MQSRACAHTCVYVSARAHLSAPKGAVRTVFWVVVAEEVVLEHSEEEDYKEAQGGRRVEEDRSYYQGDNKP